MNISEEEERKLGEQVSLQIRNTFGVYQDAAVTKYVTLVGTVLAQASSRPNLNWEFIVLDTDGVNAFAAPGGIIHITRGALGLIKNEAELAGVLGHEITHVTEKHTIGAIAEEQHDGRRRRPGRARAGWPRTRLPAVVEQAYTAVLNNKFDRNEELEADHLGVRPGQQGRLRAERPEHVLTKLAERNKDQQEPNGMFASHPQM